MANGPLTAPSISKLPLGLLGFLGIKSGGRYPEQLAAYLQPTWDQLELLGCNHYEDMELACDVTALGFNPISATTPTVPQTEVWYVSQVGGNIATGAGEAFLGIVALDNYALSAYVSLAASQTNHFLQNARTPCFWPPGSFLGIWADVGTLLLPLATPPTIAIRVSRFLI